MHNIRQFAFAFAVATLPVIGSSEVNKTDRLLLIFEQEGSKVADDCRSLKTVEIHASGKVKITNTDCKRDGSKRTVTGAINIDIESVKIADQIDRLGEPNLIPNNHAEAKRDCGRGRKRYLAATRDGRKNTLRTEISCNQEVVIGTSHNPEAADSLVSQINTVRLQLVSKKVQLTEVNDQVPLASEPKQPGPLPTLQ